MSIKHLLLLKTARLVLFLLISIATVIIIKVLPVFALKVFAGGFLISFLWITVFGVVYSNPWLIMKSIKRHNKTMAFQFQKERVNEDNGEGSVKKQY